MRRIPIIFDVDTGIDDATTLMMACVSDTLDILGVTVSYGNNVLEKTLSNTLNVLKLCGRDEIPVAAGADKPLHRSMDRDGEMEAGGMVVHGENGLGGYIFPDEIEGNSKKALQKETAWDFVYRTIREYQTPVVYCCLGPLTNAAVLLQKYPDAGRYLKCFVNMGGYIREGTLSPMSSVNIFYDAHGAEIVMDSGIPFYMCPGDLTGDALITLEEMEAMKAFRSPVGRAACEMVHAYYRTCSALGEHMVHGLVGQSMHDNCALAFIEHPELFTYGRYYCRVESQSELCVAMTVIDYEDTLRLPMEEKNLFFVDTVDREGFAAYFMECFRKYEGLSERGEEYDREERTYSGAAGL